MSKRLRGLAWTLLAGLLTMPTAIAAQGGPKADEQTQNRIGNAGSGGGTELGSIQEAFTALSNVLILFLPGVATVYFIISGYRYIVAQGNPDLVEKAKKSLTYAVFGVIIAYASAALILTFGKGIGVGNGLLP